MITPTKDHNMKTEMRHTPGPWQVDPELPACVCTLNAIPIQIARCGHPTSETARANAALIARAPDLLAENERLKAVLRRIIAMHDDAMFIFGSDDSAIVEKTLDEARAALNPLKP